MPERGFRKHPKPEPEVIDLLERVLESARCGYVRTITIVTVNPINQVETPSAGDLGVVRKTALLGGLVRAAVDLMKRP